MNKLYIRITGLLLLTTLFVQAQTKKIPFEDFSKWGQLEGEKLAPNGQWISFTMAYEEGTDTLFLQNVSTGVNLKFPNASSAEFTSDSKWFLYSTGQTLNILGLNGMISHTIQMVKKHEFDKVSGFLAILTSDLKLLIYTPKEPLPREIKNVKDFSFSPNGSLAMISDQGVQLVRDTKFAYETIASDTQNRFSKLTWDATGNRLVFFKTLPNSITTAVTYHLGTREVQFLPEESISKMKLDLQISKPLLFAPDGDRVFLYTKSTEKPKPTGAKLVEVWDAATPLHFPEQQEVERIPFAIRIQVWDLKHNNLQKLIPDSLPFIKLLPNRKFALVYNPNKIGYQHLTDPFADYYLSDLQTGELKLCLKSQSTESGLLSPSPNEAYIGYFNDSGWNIYNYKTNVNRLIFDRVSVEKEEEDEKYKSTSPGWTQDGKYMVLYIGLDIWLVSPDGREKKRITNGKETGIKFRPAKEIHKANRQIINEVITSSFFNLSEGIILYGSLPDKTTSIYTWDSDHGLVMLYKSPGKVSVLSKSEKGDLLLLEEQTATQPPNLKVLNCLTKQAVMQYQSNSQYKAYELPKTKLLSYKDEKGRELNAILHYPAGYDETKKYPMIVYIYELLSQNLHVYNSPSPYSRIGFTLANYTNDDYFVLEPDLTYTIGDPGTSALDCLLKAVNAALLNSTIDKERIGLIGHSYGGHETSLMITKTPIFAAAVAGAASTNMISDYLRLNEITNINKAWRFESHQYRMGQSPFGNWEAYMKNSPVMNAEKIGTPLLSWTGNADGTVDWKQSVELHLALRRLKKTNILLVYPGEGHILNNNQAKMDLTLRTKNWFDLYLKREYIPKNIVDENH